ncbi:hypothetical protein PCL_08885 [Purpureocillium lilacinum]|uniref:Uncharacterized protein n=1 Tax=Purpureocillium lilacinum TaxID=33203 RepID=A0A2U3EGH4_PURLI|nr:hypothetical protein PCL_08885 [Purpureocillium lilacinum]
MRWLARTAIIAAGASAGAVLGHARRLQPSAGCKITRCVRASLVAKPLPDGHLLSAGSFIAPEHRIAWHGMAQHGMAWHCLPRIRPAGVRARVQIEGIMVVLQIGMYLYRLQSPAPLASYKGRALVLASLWAPPPSAITRPLNLTLAPVTPTDQCWSPPARCPSTPSRFPPIILQSPQAADPHELPSSRTSPQLNLTVIATTCRALASCLARTTRLGSTPPDRRHQSSIHDAGREHVSQPRGLSVLVICTFARQAPPAGAASAAPQVHRPGPPLRHLDGTRTAPSQVARLPQPTRAPQGQAT